MKTRNRFCLIVFACLFLCSGFLSCSMQKCNGKAAQQWVEGKAECVMEVNSRRVLYQAHGDIRLPMASTTKIATCITVLELCNDLQTKVVIPQTAVGIEGSSVYLKTGEIYTVEDLLYGLMLRSGNDCATALALHCCGSIDIFAAKMNETAQKAGALHTNFENPHGLPSEEHYTTAYDLGLITCYAMQNPVFCEIVSSKYYDAKHWKNKNKILTLYEYGIGVKTGYTKEAGRCLVSAAKKNDMTLVCVVLNCPTTYERSIMLLEDAFASYRYKKVVSKDQPFVLETAKEKVLGFSRKDLYYPLLAEEEALLERKVIAYEKNALSKKEKDSVGEFSIYLAKQLLFSGILYKL